MAEARGFAPKVRIRKKRLPWSHGGSERIRTEGPNPKKKTPLEPWRKREDSNLRDGQPAHTISSRAPSTTRPRFHLLLYHITPLNKPQAL